MVQYSPLRADPVKCKQIEQVVRLGLGPIGQLSFLSSAGRRVSC